MNQKWFPPEEAGRLLGEGTNCFRMQTGPHGWIDWFAGLALLSFPEESAARSQLSGLKEWVGRAGLECEGIFFRRLIKGPGEKDRPVCWQERKNSQPPIALENHLRHLLDFSAGYSVGLFLDQRDNRRQLQEWIKATGEGAKVLNCFSYTCAFSMAAAAAGGRVCSVDLSSKFLNWGRKNFALNRIPEEGHQFVTEDILRFLPRLVRRKSRFDFVILDPPTFSRGTGGRVFRVEKDLSDLLELALQCTTPEAKVLLSTNCSRICTHDLLDLAANVAPDKRRMPGAIPMDCRGAPCASTVWLM